MKKKVLLSLLLVVFVSVSFCVYADVDVFEGFGEKTKAPYWEKKQSKTRLVKRFPNGLIIDWKKGVAVARGHCPLPPMRKIKGLPPKHLRQLRKETNKRSFIAALKKMGQVISRIPIPGGSNLGKEMKENKDFAKKIRKLVKNSARVLHRKVIRGKGKGPVLQTIVVFKLRGKDGLGKYLMPRLRKKRITKGIKKLQPLPKKFTYDKEHTGLIVDASGLGIEAGMSPKILSLNGAEVYGTIKASSDYVIKNGIVSYAEDLESAKKIGRAGSSPLIVKAVSLGADKMKNDVVVSEKDEYIIRKTNEKTKFLDKCNVIILI